MKQIPLSQGKFALVDDEDYEYLNQWKWYAWKHYKHKTFYAVRNIRLGNNTRTTIFMHRVILGLTDSKIQGEHRDNEGLNNLRSNIRPCTNSQNQMNRGVILNTTSGFKGVSWSRERNKWISQISISGKQKNLGRFTSKIEAAEKYNEAAIKYYGEFSKLNQI